MQDFSTSVDDGGEGEGEGGAEAGDEREGEAAIITRSTRREKAAPHGGIKEEGGATIIEEEGTIIMLTPSLLRETPHLIHR